MSRPSPLFALTLGALGACATSAPPPPAPAAEPVAVDGTPTADLIPAPRVPAEAPPVLNQPPRVKQVRVSPKTPAVGKPIHVEADAEDPEGVGTTLRYTWTVNGVEDLSQHSATFDTSELHRKDVVGVDVVAHDDEQDSAPAHAEVTMVGLPPVMDTTPGQIHTFDNVHMQAHDPDGDELAWSITGAPAGMSVDSAGVLHYQGSETEPGGPYHIAILATDGDGDFAKMELDINISPGSKAKAAKP